jgi:hypothetical protein
MGGAKEGTRNIMEVDSIAIEVATKSIWVMPDATKAATVTIHPSTLSTIVETKEGNENLQPEDSTRIAPMVEYIVFW